VINVKMVYIRCKQRSEN